MGVIGEGRLHIHHAPHTSCCDDKVFLITGDFVCRLRDRVNAAATAVLLWLCLAAAHAETLTGKVVSVDDGDTLTVLSENVRQRVRIAGIDAPEKGQDYAHRSWQSLMLMAYGKDATLDCHKTDRYQRRVCKVMVQPQGCPRCGHTLDLGLAQIVAGAARWDRRYGREQSAQERGRYASEETEARLRRRGLWGLPEPIPQSQHCVRRSERA